ncbi:DUF5683 domain-containing protein [Parabacteroides sp. PF5-6]|uniref:DUF5683 domain-containing protein n=1 Tax=Parabacteroides sp. PF5-6 TaxID=1742403 RepID=UPI0024059164|nr:DUF5683 domain-containing protein [Parabacteroides sp. PF5-6]MDF9829121.1 hypothetical protein [Parabacteroides sp. PF5-6]
MRNGIIIFLVAWLCLPLTGKAQEEQVEINALPADTLITLTPDSATQSILITANSEFQAIQPAKLEFKPDPNKAILLALIPGAGQIYNRMYWKLPIVYGAFMGCTYAVTWNNRNFQDYRNAYIDLMSDDPITNNRWMDMVPSTYQTDEEKLTWAKNNKDNVFKSRRDYFRRYRDLSIIISAGVYLLSMLDAYVDAQLFDFDISPDLSMRVEPTITPKTTYTPQTYGVNCSIKF